MDHDVNESLLIQPIEGEGTNRQKSWLRDIVFSIKGDVHCDSLSSWGLHVLTWISVDVLNTFAIHSGIPSSDSSLLALDCLISSRGGYSQYSGMQCFKKEVIFLENIKLKIGLNLRLDIFERKRLGESTFVALHCYTALFLCYGQGI